MIASCLAGMAAIQEQYDIGIAFMQLGLNVRPAKGRSTLAVAVWQSLAGMLDILDDIGVAHVTYAAHTDLQRLSSGSACPP